MEKTKRMVKNGEIIKEVNTASVRINKHIAAHSDFARRKVDEMILQGRITVNGISITEPGFKINPGKDKISVDGEPIRTVTKKVYILLNKPVGVISSANDEKHRETVTDLININERVFPIGRLDYNTTGLMLLTNDGEFANSLMHPRYKVRKTYRVKLSKPLDEKIKLRLEKGIILEDRKTLPAIITFVKVKNYSEILITLTEGRNRQVRKMFEHFGYFVRDLHRESYGHLDIKGLKPGVWRYLSPTEITKFNFNNLNSRKIDGTKRPN